MPVCMRAHLLRRSGTSGWKRSCVSHSRNIMRRGTVHMGRGAQCGVLTVTALTHRPTCPPDSLIFGVTAVLYPHPHPHPHPLPSVQRFISSCISPKAAAHECDKWRDARLYTVEVGGGRWWCGCCSNVRVRARLQDKVARPRPLSCRHLPRAAD